MSNDASDLCQAVRANAAEAVRLAAGVTDKSARATLLDFARTWIALAVKLEAASTVIVATAEVPKSR